MKTKIFLSILSVLLFLNCINNEEDVDCTNVSTHSLDSKGNSTSLEMNGVGFSFISIDKKSIEIDSNESKKEGFVYKNEWFYIENKGDVGYLIKVKENNSKEKRYLSLKFVDDKCTFIYTIIQEGKE